MSEHTQDIEAWLLKRNAKADFLRFEESVHTVEDAVRESGYPIERFTKSIVMLACDGSLVVALISADRRASTERVRKALDLEERPRLATASETEERLGQQLGGASPFNARGATVLIDPEVLAKDWILTGGGDDRSLVKISTEELTRIVEYTEARVRK